MANAKDLPSPVDAYGAPPPPIPIDDSSPASPAAVPGAAQPQYYSAPRPTNTLAIIALVASCAGLFIPFADIAGIVMGFIALNQIKRTGEGGHGLALAAVIVGFALTLIELVVVVLYFIFIIWIVGVASSTANIGSDFG